MLILAIGPKVQPAAAGQPPVACPEASQNNDLLPPRGPFGGTNDVASGEEGPDEDHLAPIDAILGEPERGAHLPEWAWAYDPKEERFIQGQWTDEQLPLPLRRTLLTNAQAHFWR